MKFTLFNATTMHNSTEKCKKIQKIKKSDLHKKNLIFSIFFKLKIMIFSNPAVLEGVKWLYNENYYITQYKRPNCRTCLSAGLQLYVCT